jgi:hypothetical protein
VDFTVVSLSLVDWNEMQEKEDLRKARMRLLDERELGIGAIPACQQGPFGPKQTLSLGDLILLFNSTKGNSRERKEKLSDNWFGPYRVRGVSDSGLL